MTTTQTAGRREWIGLAVLALPALLASLELTVTHLALPSIGRALHASSAQLLWIVDVYAFLLAGALIAMGALGDRIGRRKLLMLGALAYGVLSVVAAYAPNAETLIVVRALLGVAGSTLMPSVLALAVAMFRDPRQRTVAVGIIIASVSGGTAIGPLVGGWLLEGLWWGSVFLLAVPVMVLLMALGPLLLPEHRATAAGTLDVTSAALSLATVLPVVYGLKQIAADGLTWPSAVAVVAGIGFGAVFVRRQHALPDPMIDLELFANRAFSTAAATLALGIFVLWGTNYGVAQYLQLVRGLDPLTAGLWTAPSAIGVIAGSLTATRIVRRIRAELVIGAGLLLSAAGFVVLTQVGVTGSLAVLVAGTVVVSAGLGPMMALATDMVVAAAPPERAGAASAISSTAPQLGGGLGIAVLGSVITAVYRSEMTSETAGAPGPAVDTLGAAVALPAAPDVLDAARAAFTHGFALTAVVSAVLMVTTAALVLALARR